MNRILKYRSLLPLSNNILQKSLLNSLSFSTQIKFKLTPQQRKQLTPQQVRVVEQHEYNEKMKSRERWIKIMAILILSPFLLLFFDAKYFINKINLPQIVRNRKKKLDTQHQIDRDEIKKVYQELDKQFLITEKEEIQMMKQYGYGPNETARMRKQGKEIMKKKKDQILRKETLSVQQRNDQFILSKVKGQNFNRIEVSQNLQDKVPDPRIGGSKLMFDSRFDQVQQVQQSVKIAQRSKDKIQSKSLTFQQLSKTAKCQEKKQQDDQNFFQSLHNQQYSEVKTAFNMQNLTLQSFIQIQSQVQNLLPEWNRRMMYDNMSQRSRHNQFITWLSCGVLTVQKGSSVDENYRNKDSKNFLQQDLKRYLYFMSYDSMFGQKFPKTVDGYVNKNSIADFKNAVADEAYIQRINFFKRICKGQISEKYLKEVQKRLRNRLSSTISNFKDLSDKMFVQDNKLRLVLYDQEKYLEQMKQAALQEAQQKFKPFVSKISKLMSNLRQILKVQDSKLSDYQKINQHESNKQLREQFDIGQQPSQLQVKKINQTLRNLMRQEYEVQLKQRKAHLFNILWRYNKNADKYCQVKKDFLDLATFVTKFCQGTPQQNEKVQTQLKQLGQFTERDDIPGIGQVWKQFQAMNKNIIYSKGTKRQSQILQDTLYWIRKNLMPVALLNINSKDQRRALHKLNFALKKRDYSRAAKIFHQNKSPTQEMLLEQQTQQGRQSILRFQKSFTAMMLRLEINSTLSSILLTQ